MKKDITGLFVFTDDFCKAVDEYLSRVLIPYADRVNKVTRVIGMTLSELLTIEIFYHESLRDLFPAACGVYITYE